MTDGDALRSRVAATAAGASLLDWLVERFHYFDRGGWQEQLRTGRLRLDGERADGVERLRGGELLEFTPHAAADRAEPVPVLFADDAIVVVDKPAHAVVQRTSSFPGRTFVTTLSRRFPAHDLDVLEPVHRLDRETSGVLVLARSRAAFAALQRSFADGLVHKRYLAVAHGIVALDEVVVCHAIGPAADSTVRGRHAVLADGAKGARDAVTAFAVRERLLDATVLTATPRTGRTHQIRVHLEHLGHPLVGDVLYGHDDRRYLAFVEQQKRGVPATRPDGDEVRRHLLHAESLAFAHPLTGEQLEITAPWPEELRAYVALRTGG